MLGGHSGGGGRVAPCPRAQIMADPTDRQLLVRLLTQVAEVRANQIVTDRVVDILYLSRFDDEQRARAERELRELRRTADEDLAGDCLLYTSPSPRDS